LRNDDNNLQPTNIDPHNLLEEVVTNRCITLNLAGRVCAVLVRLERTKHEFMEYHEDGEKHTTQYEM
jgi:hypothetical protein